jgi:hypothetical protein
MTINRQRAELDVLRSRVASLDADLATEGERLEWVLGRLDWRREQIDAWRGKGHESHAMSAKKPIAHVCGLQGFGRGVGAMTDVCEACSLASEESRARDADKPTGATDATTPPTLSSVNANVASPSIETPETHP